MMKSYIDCLGSRWYLQQMRGTVTNLPLQQYPTDTGPIDILAISKDQKRLLVIELKKGRTSDVAVGQVLRYMGFVKANLLEANQEVHGMIIAYHDDLSIRLALSMVPNVTFYRYQVTFALEQPNYPK